MVDARHGARALALCALAYGALVGLRVMNPSTPVDVALNVFSFAARDELRAPSGGTRPLVVLVHGLWRSAASLGKLERALRAHGYDTLNESYPSTARSIAQHAAWLHERIDARLRGDKARAIHFVGHSMGGLVVRAYLQSERARRAASVVFIGTPQRGALLCDLRCKWWVFKIFMGDRAALELSPSSAFWRTLTPLSCPAGTIMGGCGDADGWHASIPGDDDGTVGVAEAELAGASDTVRLPIGHTRLSFHDDVIEQVLRFLGTNAFRHAR